MPDFRSAGSFVFGEKAAAVLNRAQELSSEISMCDDYTALEQTLFSSVARQLGAETSVLLQIRHNLNGYVFERDKSLGVVPETHDKYIDEFHSKDPVLVNRPRKLAHTLQDATTDVFRLSDVCDQRRFVKTRYYNEFLKPAGIRHVLALSVCPLTEKNDMMVLVGFHRPLGSRDFGDAEVRKANTLAPVIGSTISRLTFKEHMLQYRAQAHDMRRLADKTAFIILDEQLELTDVSACVYQADAQDFSALMRTIRLHCTELAATGRTQSEFIHLRQDVSSMSGNGKVRVDINMLGRTSGQRRFIVQLGCAQTDLAIARCSAEFAWTSRECDIVMAVARGLTNPQIASHLSISIRTVENHLRAVYSKAGVTSRTQLLRQLLKSIPALGMALPAPSLQ